MRTSTVFVVLLLTVMIPCSRARAQEGESAAASGNKKPAKRRAREPVEKKPTKKKAPITKKKKPAPKKTPKEVATKMKPAPKKSKK